MGYPLRQPLQHNLYHPVSHYTERDQPVKVERPKSNHLHTIL